jgi:CheY-like chemotaxis protein
MGQTRVLIVDDNEAFIEMTKFVLTEAGNIVDASCRMSSATSSPAVYAVAFYEHGTTQGV